MLEPGLVQLRHAGVDDGVPCRAGAPFVEIFLGGTPFNPKPGAERFALQHTGMVMSDGGVELPPIQLRHQLMLLSEPFHKFLHDLANADTPKFDVRRQFRCRDGRRVSCVPVLLLFFNVF